MMLQMLRNQKGFALLTVYMASIFISTISVSAYGKALYEMKQMEREITKIRSLAAAEAGVQNAMAQIGVNAYTGYVNTANFSVGNFQATDGKAVGSYSVTMSYPNQADWIVVQSIAVVDGETRTLEGRIFLDSNLSKYLVYADSPDFSSGTNAQYGEPDMTDAYGDGVPDYPEYVPSNETDRAGVYFTGDWTLSGSNIQMYGDANAQGKINGNSGSQVHGDTYVGSYTLGSSGVSNSGVTGGLKVGDGFSDDSDRNGDTSVNTLDYPDYHDLTSAGGGDSHKTETITPIDNNFYKSHNAITAYSGTTAQNRYLKFVSSAGSTTTQVVEYTNSTFATVANTYNLSSSAIIYVNGNIYTKGEIGGRLSIVSSSSIFFDGNLTYSGGQNKADANHSASFMAKDRLYFRANDLSVSGILYGENSSDSAAGYDANYNTSGAYDPTSKVQLHLYGNRVINGATNLGVYPTRVYGYDGQLKYFRPPGIPVVPTLRMIREK